MGNEEFEWLTHLEVIALRTLVSRKSRNSPRYHCRCLLSLSMQGSGIKPSSLLLGVDREKEEFSGSLKMNLFNIV